MKTQKKLSKWYYAAVVILAVGGATGCLYSAAAAAIMIGYSMVRAARMAPAPDTMVSPDTVRFGIASQPYDDGVIDVRNVPPIKQEYAAAA